MATILCKVNGSASGKPRVYFTCHPDDFDQYFQKICDDIFKTHDVAIYYTEDMAEAIAEEDRETDLGSNNLFVVPVTFRLLSTPSRAMDSDIPYALEQHIPVLPFMMEPGIDAFYAKKFGELQYLNPYSTDLTEVRYEDKLKKYLESVLISDETAKRVREAFDAYIFLSYRKKDRRYANELMRLIHKNPEYRDIAIWYDEFLTPGESFQQNIDRMLKDSKLFTLLVTPQLLEMPGGKANFVMDKEYPDAKAAGLPILPTEMEETDKAELKEKFPDVPECVNARDENTLNSRLAETLSRIAIAENNGNAEHNFLIGLAYLEGIDVEVDRQRGVELITSAAEAELPEAMEKLFDMYLNGKSVTLDYHKAAFWGEKLVEYYTKNPDIKLIYCILSLTTTYLKLGDAEKALEHCKKIYASHQTLGEDHPVVLANLNNLASIFAAHGHYQKNVEILEQVYAHACRFDEEHIITLLYSINLARAYESVGNQTKALTLAEKAYTLLCKNCGEEHPYTLACLDTISQIYEKLGNYCKELEFSEKTYNLSCKVLGEKHPDTLLSLHGLAHAHGNLGNYQKALELLEKDHSLFVSVLGETHPKTLTCLSDIAIALGRLGNHSKQLELCGNVYHLRYKTLGEKHPDTILSLHNLAAAYRDLKKYPEAVALYTKAHTLRCEILGETHPDTLITLNNLAYTYVNQKDFKNALETMQILYQHRKKLLGKGHPDTIDAAKNIELLQKTLYDILEQFKKTYALRCKNLGKKHPDTILSLGALASAYFNLKNYKKALTLYEKAYALFYKVSGENHPYTLGTFRDIAISHYMLKNYGESLTFFQLLYQRQLLALGKDHPDTVQTAKDIEALKKIIG